MSHAPSAVAPIDADEHRASVRLVWIPLGAGHSIVRASGAVYETIVALVHGRPRRDLYHSALVIRAPAGRFTIEMAPTPDAHCHG